MKSYKGLYVPEKIELSFGKGYVNLKYKGMNHSRVTLSGHFTPEDIKKAIGDLEIRVGRERRAEFRGERRSRE
ncbi:MAG: hypothetical protein V1660_02180 [archaeon]